MQKGIEVSPATIGQFDSGSRVVRNLLRTAATDRQRRMLAVELVSSWLDLKFPEAVTEIDNDSLSNSASRICLNGYEFVIVSCEADLDQDPLALLQLDLPKVLLVPVELESAARQLVSAAPSPRVSVNTIESFVGTSLDWNAQYDEGQLRFEITRLVNEVKERVTLHGKSDERLSTLLSRF